MDVPCPSLVSTSTSPLISIIFLLTTSIPTPLPDTPVTFSAVENPGRNNNSIISFFDKLTSAETNPLLIALFLTLSRSTPAPSSVILIITFAPE